MRTKSNVNSVDTWSWVHFFGSAFLVFAFRETGAYMFGSVLFTIMAGILQEIFDEIRKVTCHAGKINLWDKFFDRRGASWLDLMFDTGGVALSVGIILL